MEETSMETFGDFFLDPKAVEGVTYCNNASHVMSGYLGKKSIFSPSDTPKDRFYILSGNILTCFSNHMTLNESRGEVFLFAETEVEEVESSSDEQPTIIISKPFDAIILRAASEADHNIWVHSLRSAVERAKLSMRAYLLHRTSTQHTTLKYFVLHENVVTSHKDVNALKSVYEHFYLRPSTFADFDDAKRRVILYEAHTANQIFLKFMNDLEASSLSVPEDQNGIYEDWKAEILRRLNIGPESQLLKSAVLRVMLPSYSNRDVISMDSVDLWPEATIKLFSNQIIVLLNSGDGRESESHAVLSRFILSPNCCVFETSLGERTFEVVTADTVLHLSASRTVDMKDWIVSIKAAISASIMDYSDPLFQQALLKIDDDEFYTLHITEKAPLGVVFERSGEWAIIKSSSMVDKTGIFVGSVLTAVNDKSVIMSPYEEVIGMLKNWAAPLRLTFRRTPQKEGYLLKQSKSRSDPSRVLWKKRYFILGDGVIGYKDKISDSENRVELPLMGSAISLLSPAQTGGRPFCFRIISSISSLYVQSANEKQMMEWAASLYHAIALANGGTYILEYERDRLRFEEAADAEGSSSPLADTEFLLVDAVADSSPSSSSFKEPQPSEQSKLMPDSPSRMTSADAKAAYLHATSAERDYNQDYCDRCLATITRLASVEDFADLAEVVSHSKTRVGRSGSMYEVIARARLLQLQSGFERKEEILSLLERATASQVSSDLTEALEIAEEYHIGGDVVHRARSVLDSLQRRDAKYALASALLSSPLASPMATPTPSRRKSDTPRGIKYRKLVQITDAIAKAEKAQVSRALIDDADMELKIIRALAHLILIEEKTTPGKIPGDNRSEGYNTPEKYVTAGSGDSDDDDSLQNSREEVAVLSRNQRRNAETILNEAIFAAEEEGDPDSLVFAINLAIQRGVVSPILDQAINTLKTIDPVLADEILIHGMLAEAMISSSIPILSTAVSKARAVKYEGATLDDAVILLDRMVNEDVAFKIFSYIADGIRLKSSTAIRRALVKAEREEIDGEGISLAKLCLEQFEALDQAEATNNSAKALEIRQQIAVSAPRAIAALQPSRLRLRENPRGSSTKGLFSDVDAGSEAEAVATIWSRTRESLSSPKFDSMAETGMFTVPGLDSESTKDVLRKVFYVHGLKTRYIATTIAVKVMSSVAEDRGSEKVMNAMQFSSIWRRVTGERGNLFKEMQMFKRFDKENRGTLCSDDFVNGWLTLAKEAETGPHLIQQLRLLAAAKSKYDD